MLDLSNFDLYRSQPNLDDRLHSKLLDKRIGYRISKIEDKLLRQYRAYDRCEDNSSDKKHYPDTQAWIGLNSQVLQTNYSDIFGSLHFLRSFQINTIVDIGAAYGRVGIVSSAVFPKANFIGYEVVKSRFNEAKRVYFRHKLNNCDFVNVNVLDDPSSIEAADIYFIYDFSELSHISIILKKLYLRRDSKPFFLISHGERIDSLMSKFYKEFKKLENHSITSGLKIYCSNLELQRSP